MATLHITADKRLRCHAPTLKLPTATSFIRKTLWLIAGKSALFDGENYLITQVYSQII